MNTITRSLLRRLFLLTLSWICSQSAPRGWAAPGDLDLTFGGTGKVTTTLGSGSFAQGVAVQSDGKIVIAGSASISNPDFAVARYNVDGSLDTSFNFTGKVVTDIAGGSDTGQSVAVQNDGKIVVAGSSLSNRLGITVVRYNANGSLDAGFNGTGKVTTFIGSGTDWAEARSVAVQGDGKIVVAGYARASVFNGFALVRYNGDGSLDTSFNGTGIVTTIVGGNASDEANSVAVQSDGKIVAAGFAYVNGKNDFAVVRYLSDGSLDTAFNGTGKVTTDFSLSEDVGRSVAVQGDGKIVVAGYFNNGNDRDFALVRYNANGSLDAGFGAGGKVGTPIGSFDEAFGVAVQSDGRVVAAGFSQSGNDSDFAVVRYRADGNLDTRFGGTGIVTTAFQAATMHPVSHDNPPGTQKIKAMCQEMIGHGSQGLEFFVLNSQIKVLAILK